MRQGKEAQSLDSMHGHNTHAHSRQARPLRWNLLGLQVHTKQHSWVGGPLGAQPAPPAPWDSTQASALSKPGWRQQAGRQAGASHAQDKSHMAGQQQSSLHWRPKRITHKEALSHGLHANSSTKLHTRYTHSDESYELTHRSRGADATEAQHTSCHAALSKQPQPAQSCILLNLCYT